MSITYVLHVSKKDEAVKPIIYELFSPNCEWYRKIRRGNVNDEFVTSILDDKTVDRYIFLAIINAPLKDINQIVAFTIGIDQISPIANIDHVPFYRKYGKIDKYMLLKPCLDRGLRVFYQEIECIDKEMGRHSRPELKIYDTINELVKRAIVKDDSVDSLKFFDTRSEKLADEFDRLGYIQIVKKSEEFDFWMHCRVYPANKPSPIEE